MKDVFVKIGKLLLDVCIFVISTIAWFILGGILCAGIALVWVLVPIMAIYCAVTEKETLMDGLVDEIEILISSFISLFKKEDES